MTQKTNSTPENALELQVLRPANCWVSWHDLEGDDSYLPGTPCEDWGCSHLVGSLPGAASAEAMSQGGNPPPAESAQSPDAQMPPPECQSSEAKSPDREGDKAAGEIAQSERQTRLPPVVNRPPCTPPPADSKHSAKAAPAPPKASAQAAAAAESSDLQRQTEAQPWTQPPFNLAQVSSETIPAKAAPVSPNLLPSASSSSSASASASASALVPETQVVESLGAKGSTATAATRGCKSQPARLRGHERRHEHRKKSRFPDPEFSKPDRAVPVILEDPNELINHPYMDVDWTLPEDGSWTTECKRRQVRNELIKNQLLSGRPAMYKSTGNSLAPTIYSGDWVVLNPVQNPATDICVGDIVFCQIVRDDGTPTHYYCHVVLEKTSVNKNRNGTSWTFRIGNMKMYNTYRWGSHDHRARENGKTDEEHIWGKVVNYFTFDAKEAKRVDTDLDLISY